MFCEGSVAIGMVRWSGRSLGFAKCGDYRGDYSGEDADAEEHEGDCGELTDNRYRVMVAVAHGGDSNKRPVEGVGKGTNVCAVRVLLHGCYDGGGKQDDSNAVCKQGFKVTRCLHRETSRTTNRMAARILSGRRTGTSTSSASCQLWRR